MDKQTQLFIDRLNYAMAKQGMKAAELSRRTGISPAILSQYRKGLYLPKQNRVYLLAEALKVSPSWLIGLDDLEFRPSLATVAQELFEELSPQQQEAALEYLRYLTQQKENQ